MFFQDLPFWMSEYVGSYNVDGRDEGVGILLNAYEEVFDHDYYDAWFDNEIKRFCNINVFDYPFDKERGSLVINKGRFSLLILQMEKLDSPENSMLIEDFLGESFKAVRANSGGNKWYASAYKRFKECCSYTTFYLDDIYSCKTVRHFYSEQDLAAFRGKRSVKVG